MTTQHLTNVCPNMTEFCVIAVETIHGSTTYIIKFYYLTHVVIIF